MRGRRPLSPFVWLAAATLVASCGDGRTPLVLYSPHGRDLLLALESSFEAREPGIDVRYLDMGSQEVFDRVRSEQANPQADVWFGGPATILDRGVEAGLLAPYRPAWADATPPEGRHPGDCYFAAYRMPAILVYNRDAVAAEAAPRDWDDLLAPRFAGQLLIRDPLASGTMRTVFAHLLLRAEAASGDLEDGFAWLARLDAQTKSYVSNPALMHEMLARQEGLVTVWDLTDILLQQQRGLPLGYHFPTSGTPVIRDSLGLVAGAPHAAAAQRFIDWVGSAEAQLLAAERAFRLPARTDLSPLPDWVAAVEAELVESHVDWERVTREGPDWMRRWDRSIRGRAGG